MITHQGPEPEHGTLSDDQKVQIDQNSPDPCSTKGEAQNHVEYGCQGAAAQRPPVPALGLTFDSSQGGRDISLARTDDQKPHRLGVGTSCVAVVGTEYGNDPTGEPFRSLRFGQKLMPTSSLLP